MSQHFPDIFSDGYSISSGQTETRETETEETASRPPVKVSDLQLGQGGQTGAGRTSLKYKLLGLKMSQNIFSFIKNVTTKHIHKIFPSKYRLVFSDTRH